jgi:hypothetical protein
VYVKEEKKRMIGSHEVKDLKIRGFTLNLRSLGTSDKKEELNYTSCVVGGFGSFRPSICLSIYPSICP